MKMKMKQTGCFVWPHTTVWNLQMLFIYAYLLITWCIFSVQLTELGIIISLFLDEETDVEKAVWSLPVVI